MSKRNSCESCKYFESWQDSEDSSLGSCRRYPPVHVPNAEHEDDRWDFPHALGKCGEYKISGAKVGGVS
jgi:hypothetical protein